MGLVSATQMLLKASSEGYAVGAFNITNLIQMEAVVEGATERRAPLIIQTSVSPSKFLRADVLVAACRALAEQAPIPICLHLDHCTEVDYCKFCAETGYTNIMIDASKQSFDENIARTKEVSEHAHRNGISVEGELGTVAGVEDQVKVMEDEAQLCDPGSAIEFVERTGIDLFAPAIGTAHGVYKTADPKVDFERLAAIKQAFKAQKMAVPLVIHGGTGLPEDTVRRLIELGGAKFNVSTELKHILIDTTYAYIHANREEYNPGKVDTQVKAAIKQGIQNWIDQLGCAGKA